LPASSTSPRPLSCRLEGEPALTTIRRVWWPRRVAGSGMAGGGDHQRFAVNRFAAAEEPWHVAKIGLTRVFFSTGFAELFRRGLQTRPSSVTAGLPVHGCRRVTRRSPVGRTAGSGDSRRTKPGHAAKLRLTHVFFSTGFAVLFGRGLQTRPSSVTAGLPVHGCRRVTRRPPVGQTAGSGDPRRTKLGSQRSSCAWSFADCSHVRRLASCPALACQAIGCAAHGCQARKCQG